MQEEAEGERERKTALVGRELRERGRYSEVRTGINWLQFGTWAKAISKRNIDGKAELDSVCCLF